MSESGIYYVVPDQYGRGGKKLVRRHPPPLTTAPLDDNFDAVTQSQGYTAITPTIERIENESYYSHYGYDRDGQTSVPLDDDFDAMTYDYTTVSKSGWRGYGEGDDNSSGGVRRKMYEGLARASPIRSSDTSQSTSGQRRGSGDSAPWEGVRSTGGSSRTGDPEVSRTERSGGMDRSPLRNRAETGSIRSRTMSEIQRRPLQPPALGSSKSLTKRATGEVRPTKLGEQFEMVRRKIIEDSPEKTVTISMWRENVADQAGSASGSRASEVGMSAYYVNPDDYAVEEGGDARREEIVSEVPMYGDGRSGSRTKVRRLISESTGRAGRRSIGGDGASGASYDYGDRYRYGSPLRQENYHSTWVSTPEGHSGGSPPIQSRIERSGPTTNTTGIRKKNGSRSSQGDTPMSLGARNILASCTPSLLHVAPILVGLGITTEDHLRAMVRLNEDTRDRVVRDEALRKGITVMEWAILLDRLRELS